MAVELRGVASHGLNDVPVGCKMALNDGTSISSQHWGKQQLSGHPSLGSPRTSSAWSTQDGFAMGVDPERDPSLESVHDFPAWAADLQHQRSDQDSDVACSSGSHGGLNVHQQDGKLYGSNDGAMDADQAGPSDAGTIPDLSRSKGHPAPTPVQLKSLRAGQQLEALVKMIRTAQQTELDMSASFGFLEHQDPAMEPITPQMLMIVASWLSEVAFEFSMQQETLFLAVSLLARFLDGSTGVPRGVLQLVAVACMMIAAKAEEVVHPTVQELTDIAANCFTAQDLLRMERILLDSLQWRIKTPTAYNFLHLYTQGTAAKRAASSAQPASEPLTGAVVAKAAYLIELALMDYNMLRFGPSLVAASALMLSESWSPQGAAVDEIKLLSGFSAMDMQACMSRLVCLHKAADTAEGKESLAPLMFIKEKYSQDCWLNASHVAVPQNAELPCSSVAGGSSFAVDGGAACHPMAEDMEL